MSGQNFPMLLKSPSPPLGICKAVGGTSSKVERAEIYLVAPPPPWKVDGNISPVCSSRAQPFQLYSLHTAVRSSQMAPSKAFSHGMDRNETPQRDGSTASRQEGQGSFPYPGEMGLKDGGAWRMGGGMKDGRGVKDRVAHMQPPAYRGQFLICFAPSPQKYYEGFCLALKTEATFPRLLESLRQTPDLHPSGCTFLRPFAERENPDHSFITTRL